MVDREEYCDRRPLKMVTMCEFHRRQAAKGIIRFTSPPPRAPGSGKRGRRRQVYAPMPGGYSLVFPDHREFHKYAAAVDTADMPMLSKVCRRWQVDDRGNGLVYLVAMSGKFKGWRLHEVLGGRAPEGREWDHIDGNGLNNRRANLRLVTRKENAANRRPPRRGRRESPPVLRHGAA